MAGGKCADLNDRPLSYNKPHPKANGIIATNGRLHQQVVTVLSPFGAARSEPNLPV